MLHRVTRRLLVAALVTTIALGMVPPVAHADNIADKQAEARQIAAKLVALQRQEGALTEKYDAARERLVQLQTKVDVAKRKVGNANATIDARRKDVANYALHDYVSGSRSGGDVAALLQGSPSDWGQRKSYASFAIGDREAVLNELAVAKDDAAHETASLSQAIDAAAKTKQDAQDQRANIDKAVADEKALNDKVQGELVQLVAQEQARQAAEQQRLAEEKVRRQAEAAKAAAPPPAPPDAGKQAPAAAPSTTTAPRPQADAPGPTSAPAPSTTTAPRRQADAPGPTSAAAPSTTTAPRPQADALSPTSAAAPSTTTAPRPQADASSPAPAPAPPTAPARVPTPSNVGGDARAKIVAAAESQVGVPYVWGGETPGQGFDCSGLVQWAYGQAGISTPRVATAQLHASRRIAISDLRPGDLVFYDGNDSFMGHVAIYVGNGQIVHALHSGAPVMYNSLYFWDAIAGAGTYF